MSITPQTRNVTKAFRLATEDDRKSGREWYERARRLAIELAETYDGIDFVKDDSYDVEVAIERAAAVIAVLSPRLSWPKNVELAQRAYYRFVSIATPPGSSLRPPSADEFTNGWPGLKGNAVKAFRILSGEDPDDVISGPKVRAFWHTIVDPADPRAVVVDRHAIDIALGQVTDDETRGKVLGRKGAYDAVAQCYIRAARIIQRETGQYWTPAQVQAVTWTYWRRERAAANHGEA